MSTQTPEQSTIPAGPPQQSLLVRLGNKYSVDPEKMIGTLKATVFKGNVSNEQMMALLVVADQYDLNPWTKEIYAFPDRQNGIVPVIGVDGWCRIINNHSEFDGMTFTQDDESCTCTIYRKDRAHPVEVTEYMQECRRDAGPWKTHPRRMLRHKAMIQCSRIAFGFVGVFDQDEAGRIVERDVTQEIDKLPMTSRTESVKAKLKNLDVVDQDTGEIQDPIYWNHDDVSPTPTYAQLADRLLKSDGSDDAVAQILDESRGLPTDQQSDLLALSVRKSEGKA